MASLHIEHAVTDLATWTEAYAKFAEMRHTSGVTAESVRHPPDEQNFVVIDLEFDTAELATAFLEILRTRVWAVPANSPALVGTPQARVLERLR